MVAAPASDTSNVQRSALRGQLTPSWHVAVVDIPMGLGDFANGALPPLAFQDHQPCNFGQTILGEGALGGDLNPTLDGFGVEVSWR